MSISPICSPVCSPLCAFPLIPAAATSSTSGPVMPAWPSYALFIALGLIALAVAAAIGAFRPAGVDGPDRLEPNEPASPLWLVTGLAIFLWLVVPTMYGVMKFA